MSNRILIFKPRLDVSFKQGIVPKDRGEISPIRVHWKNFVDELYWHHCLKLDEIDIVEMPLWQITSDIVKNKAKEYDIVYMPHKQKKDFDCGDNVLYYAQTVFPWLFTIDSNGWGASCSFIKYLKYSTDESVKYDEESSYNKLKRYLESNKSKFDQPTSTNDKFPYKDYMLFLCQIPHDETIKYHSNISVLDALKQTIDWCKKRSYNLLVKGHPVNPESMLPLKEETLKHHNTKWIENVSLLDCINNSVNCFTVNSGSGMEALILGKGVTRFGEAEYNLVTPHFDEKDNFEFNSYAIANFIEQFVNKCFDTRINRKEM